MVKLVMLEGLLIMRVLLMHIYYQDNMLKQLVRMVLIVDKAKLLQRELLETYELTANKAMTVGKGKTFNAAIKNDKAKQFLNESGLKASNRDALIPQVDNRLLFTQSKDARIRMLGQFLSWSQAKSAQTNKILQRVESGDVRNFNKIISFYCLFFSGIRTVERVCKIWRCYN